jgi:hypothetical protein
MVVRFTSDRLLTWTLGPRSWLDVLNMTISLSIEQGNGAYVTPLPGSLQESPASADEYLMASLFFDVGSSGVPLLPGSRLFGVVTCTRRDLIITSTWGFSSVYVAYSIRSKDKLVLTSFASA